MPRGQGRGQGRKGQCKGKNCDGSRKRDGSCRKEKDTTDDSTKD